MKKLLYAALTFAALAAMLFVPQIGSAAASITPPITPLPIATAPVVPPIVPPIIVLPIQPGVGPLTVSLSPLAAPGFQSNVLMGGKQPLFGLSVTSLTATANGVKALAVMDPYGRISIAAPGTVVPAAIAGAHLGVNYCVSLTVRYALNNVTVSASASSCHPY